jgi:hypothetical protein
MVATRAFAGVVATGALLGMVATGTLLLQLRFFKHSCTGYFLFLHFHGGKASLSNI